LACRVEDDGELLVRGPLVMKGYRKEPRKTAEAIDSAAGTHGDIDPSTRLPAHRRSQEGIDHQCSGKNMSPTNIENTSSSVPLIGTVMVSARPALQHRVDCARCRLSSTNIPYSKLVDEITAVSRLPTRNCPVEQIQRFRVLPVFWSLAATNSPHDETQASLHRPEVCRRIDELYASHSDHPKNDPAERMSSHDALPDVLARPLTLPLSRHRYSSPGA